MSMISNQIKDLKWLRDTLKKGKKVPEFYESQWQIIDGAIDTIQTLSAKVRANNLHDGWIPCNERLPKKPECGDNGYIVQRKHVAEPFSAYWDGERWTNEDDDVINEVMAWMPLPEPYREDD